MKQTRGIVSPPPQILPSQNQFAGALILPSAFPTKPIIARLFVLSTVSLKIISARRLAKSEQIMRGFQRMINSFRLVLLKRKWQPSGWISVLPSNECLVAVSLWQAWSRIKSTPKIGSFTAGMRAWVDKSGWWQQNTGLWFNLDYELMSHMLLAISCPWMTPPPANLLRVQRSIKSRAGHSQAFNLFLGEGWRWGGGRHRPLSGVIIWADRAPVRSHLLLVAWEKKIKQASTKGWGKAREEIRHFQKTKGAL